MKAQIHSFIGYWSGGMGFLLNGKPVLDVILVLFGITNLALSMYYLIKKNKKNDTGKYQDVVSNNSRNSGDRLTPYPHH